jgi:hypothetical protein
MVEPRNRMVQTQAGIDPSFADMLALMRKILHHHGGRDPQPATPKWLCVARRATWCCCQPQTSPTRLGCRLLNWLPAPSLFEAVGRSVGATVVALFAPCCKQPEPPMPRWRSA